ncbi:MAG: twin-arginine translocase subunit TatC [Bacteroidales bacterium]|nr:twin-arginine translocase subunit TatC [Bacteroidales bacterium]
MSFLDHLEELRWHIIRSLIAVFVLAVFAFIIQDFIFQELIFKPKSPDFWTNRMFAKMAEFFNTDALRINQKEIELINIKLPGQFNMSMWTAMIAGLIMAAPVVFWEFWKFIKPALYENEKKVATGAVFYTTFLFILGLLFGYYLIVPLSIQFFGNYSISPDVSNQINITSYISMVVSIVFASGVVFLLPVFSYSLSKVGLLTPEFMRTYRKHAIVVLVLLAAIITPPDVFSQILVALPLLLLYEVSIFISARVVKNMEKKERMAANAS